ncbi:hypothetical protein DdX_17515 [Ditylenchus destructor]|uniref:Uncharacterized protein n=1 Tax=Ditylenchus destructor TaxID=166010 RepID=A0AAD4MMA1_9BILA|nr:hypothetical protein DdX_17515 [Ditylenchus destructor]
MAHKTSLVPAQHQRSGEQLFVCRRNSHRCANSPPLCFDAGSATFEECFENVSHTNLLWNAGIVYSGENGNKKEIKNENAKKIENVVKCESDKKRTKRTKMSRERKNVDNQLGTCNFQFPIKYSFVSLRNKDGNETLELRRSQIHWSPLSGLGAEANNCADQEDGDDGSGDCRPSVRLPPPAILTLIPVQLGNLVWKSVESGDGVTENGERWAEKKSKVFHENGGSDRRRRQSSEEF